MTPIIFNRRLSITSWIGILCTIAIGSVAVLLCGRVPSAREGSLSPERTREMANVIARAEPIMRKKAEREFPGDLWSQGDAYFRKEENKVRAVAAKQNVSVGFVLNALDQYLRAKSRKPNRNTVPPCKPRPYYD